jgi:hypothetical protein
MNDKIITQLDRIEEKLDRLLTQAEGMVTETWYADGELPVIASLSDDEWPEWLENEIEIGTINFGDKDE